MPIVEYLYLILIDVLSLYLDIRHHKLHRIWPIVDVTSLIPRSQMPDLDVDAYMLMFSVCVATILQLQLGVGSDGANAMPKAEFVIDAIEDLRR